jgi:hypothetical protein
MSITLNGILSSTGAKFYYSSDSSANYTIDAYNNVSKWKNIISGGLDASANINASAGGYYPKIVSTYTGGTFKYPMIKILNTVGYNTGFDYIGGGKLANEPNQQTFFIFGYMYGTNPNSYSLGMMFSKPGPYAGDTTNGGTLHIGWDGYENINNFSIINSSSTGYYTPNKFYSGYYMLCATTDCSGVSGTLVNCHAYPNLDTTFINTTMNNPNRTTDLHNWNIGYWNQAGVARSLNSAVGEVMYFNRILTNDERYFLEGKIAWKYDVSNILPASHPYKMAAPVEVSSLTAPSANNIYTVSVKENAVGKKVFSFYNSSTSTWQNQLDLSFNAGYNYSFNVSDVSNNGYQMVFGTVVDSSSNLISSSFISRTGTPGVDGVVALNLQNYTGSTVYYFESTRTGMGYTKAPITYNASISSSTLVLTDVSSTVIANPSFKAGTGDVILNVSNASMAGYSIVLGTVLNDNTTVNSTIATYNAISAGTTGALVQLNMSTYTGATLYPFVVQASSTFQVSSITSLVADFDASANVTSSNSYVSSWVDKFGGITASAGTTPKITANYINTYPAIDFGSVNGSILTTNNASTTTTAITMFFVMKAYSRGGYCNFCSSRFGWAVGAIHLLLNTNQFQFALNGSSTVHDFYPGLYPTLESPFILAITINTLAGCTINHRYNGTAGTLYSTSSGGTTNIVANFELGNWSGDTARTFNGGIGEFIYYNRILSTTEIQQVEGYLGWKWGLQTNLPNTHPYYSATPTNTVASSGTTGTVSSMTQYKATISNSLLYLNGVLNPSITFIAGQTYILDQSDSSNINNPIVFSTTSNSTSTLYTTGVSIFGSPGNSGAYTRLDLSSAFTGSLYTLLSGTASSGNSTPFVCFLKGSKITCLNDETGEDHEVAIENITLGTFVKTYLHGYIPVSIIGTKVIYNPGNDSRTKDRLYRCSSDKYPELTEDLMITGCHSILVDQLTEEQRAKTLEDTMDIFITDDKYRLMCFLDPRSEPYVNEGTFTIYHITLEHTDGLMNYGIYANGLLVESCSKRSMQEKSYMKLISTVS